jgi:hypothetical protein
MRAGSGVEVPGASSYARRDLSTISARRRHGRDAPKALQRRVSLVLVIRTQVQPVSVQTRSSPIPGAP